MIEFCNFSLSTVQVEEQFLTVYNYKLKSFVLTVLPFNQKRVFCSYLFLFKFHSAYLSTKSSTLHIGTFYKCTVIVSQILPFYKCKSFTILIFLQAQHSILFVLFFNNSFVLSFYKILLAPHLISRFCRPWALCPPPYSCKCWLQFE